MRPASLPRHARSAGSLLLAAGFLLPTLARAQSSSDIAGRRALLEQAQAARRTGDHARALDLSQRALTIQSTPSVRRFVAEEQQSLGQFAEALGSAEQCVRESAAGAHSRDQAQTQSACAALVTAVRPRVGHVVVRVPSPAPADLRVTVNGHPLNEAFWGVESVVTPGTVTVEASAPHFESFRREVSVTLTATPSVDIALVAIPVVATPNPTNPTAAPSEASVRVIVSPPAGATLPADLRVTFDGTVVAENPSTLGSIVPGDHVVEVTAEGFRRTRREITLGAGQFRAVSIELETAPRVGHVAVRIPTPNALVSVDGSPIGVAPVTLDNVEPGTHTIRIEAQGYLTLTRQITVTAGDTATLDLGGLAIDPHAPPPAGFVTGPTVVVNSNNGPQQHVRYENHTVHSGVGPFFMVFGALTGAGSVAAYLISDSNYHSLYNACIPPLRCPNDARDQQNTIQTLDTVGLATAIGGGGLFALGLVLYFTVTHQEAVPVPMTGYVNPIDRTAGVSIAF